jgi:serine protease Do
MALHALARAAAIGTTILVAGLVGAGPALAAQSPPPSPSPGGADSAQQSNPAERAAATIRPAIVYISESVTGWVVDQNGVALNGGRPFHVTARCTGFGVSSAGYVATAGHCVDTTGSGEIRSLIIRAAAATVAPGGPRSESIKHPEDDPAGPLSPDDQRYAEEMANWSVEGSTKGSPPDLSISVISDASSTGQTVTPGAPTVAPVPPSAAGQGPAAAPGRGLPARVVDYQPLKQGDVALLKIEATDLPVALLAPDGVVQIGTPVLSVGYPSSADSLTDPSLEPSVKNGQVSSRRTLGTVPTYETSAAISHGMSGGPTIDLDARVLGVNSWSPSDEPQAFNFMAPSSGLSELLARNGVRNELGPDDVAYRSALADYYAGRYTEAIAAFDRLQQSHPQHTQAVQFKILAVRARDSFGDTPVPAPGSHSGAAPAPFWSPFWSLIGGARAVVLLGGALAALVLFRGRGTEPEKV